MVGVPGIESLSPSKQANLVPVLMTRDVEIDAILKYHATCVGRGKPDQDNGNTRVPMQSWADLLDI